MAKPVSISVDTFGIEKVSDQELEVWVCNHFDLRPAAIIEKMDLRRPIYLSTAAYGHFGSSIADHTWENLDNDLIKSAKRLLR